MTKVYLGLGSNVGDRQGYLDLACQEISHLPRTKLLRVSPVYETDPVGPVPMGPFLNAVVELQTQLEPLELLSHLQTIQTKAGRPPEQARVKWGPRTLDLDILLFGERVVSSDRLIVPHPLMHERWFVLKPLADLDPNLVHPLLEMTIGELLKYLDQPTQAP